MDRIVTSRRISLVGIVSAALLCSAPMSATVVPKDFIEVAGYVGVPPKILYAVALAESGQTVNGVYTPWPWTLNVDGKPARFKTREAMYQAFMSAIKTGETNIGVGRMQINWHWKYELISSPWRLSDPIYNTKLSAEILKGHFLNTGEWWRAVEKYHRESNAPEHRKVAQEYGVRVKRIFEAFDE